MKSLLKKLFAKDDPLDYDCHIFDCRRIDYISNLTHYRPGPDSIIYQFYVYFNSGLVLHLKQEVFSDELYDCPQLIRLRELFINNLGFSYFKLDFKFEETEKYREIQFLKSFNN